MRETNTKYRQRVYQRPVFKKRRLEILGDTFPPDNTFLFEDIVLKKKHLIEDICVTIKRTVEPYNGQGSPSK